jgi:adenylate kinase family enzyme
VRRVVIVGPGAADKSTLAACLGSITGLPVIELDKVFWRPGLVAPPREEWVALQHQLGPFAVISRHVEQSRAGHD